MIAITGILIAILLPAVQAAREAARASQCANTMKQLGIALYAYDTANGCFPPAGIGYGWCWNEPASGNVSACVGDKTILNASGLMMLLPYLDQMPLYNAYDQNSCACNLIGGPNVYPDPAIIPASGAALKGDAISSGNAQVVSTPLAAFSCPSDSGKRFFSVGDGAYNITASGTARGARTNYDFCVGNSATNLDINPTTIAYLPSFDARADIDGYCNFWSRTSSKSRRMFGQNSCCRTADVRDGLSNTIAMAETTCDVANGNGNAWGYRAWVMTGTDPHGGLCINDWSFGGYFVPIPGRLGSWGRMGSCHPGGAYAMMGDGSVHFLNENIDFTLLDCLAAMADGSVVAAP